MVSQQHIRIGLPRALPYHKYAPMWISFLKALGCEIVTSPETNHKILEKGCEYAIDENCLALKIYLGHVESLLDKVDYILIPRLVSLYKREELCIHFMSLGDVVRSTFKNASLLEYTVDTTNNLPEWRGFFKIGRTLTKNPLTILRAYRTAQKRLHEHNTRALQKQERMLQSDKSTAARVLIVAHSYIVNDALMGKRVTRLLENLDVEMVYADVVDVPSARQLSYNLSTDLYWSDHRELLGAIELHKSDVDGIVFVITSPCGPDSLLVHLCEHRISDLPICVITLDELQDDAGLENRLEKFIDTLHLKKRGSHEHAHRLLPANG